MPITKWDIGVEEATAIVAAMQDAATIDNMDFRILDAGGAVKPLVFATHILDIRSYSDRAKSGHIPVEASRGAERFSEDTWLQMNMCETPWPYEDNYFDVIWCTQTIEDVRDPIGVLKEMSRVGKVGFLQTIHRNFESLLNVEDSNYAGYVHHKWLIEPDDDKLRFTFKFPLIHVEESLRPHQTGEKYINLWWVKDIVGWEHIPLSREAIVAYFEDYKQEMVTELKLDRK